jgi:hypothetical protein
MLGTPDPTLADLSVWQDNTNETSYQRFGILAQRYLGWIAEAEQSLYLTSRPLCEWDNVLLPVQCREAIIALKKINEHTQNFYKQLNQLSRLSQLLLCSKLLFILHCASEESSKLVILINSYCTTDKGLVSSYALLQRKHIATSFKNLLTLIAELSSQVKQLDYEREIRSSSSQSTRITEPLCDFI